MDSNADAVMPILNGSSSETKKNEEIERACNHFGLNYLGKPREELIEKNKAEGFDSIITWLEETRKNQGDLF